MISFVPIGNHLSVQCSMNENAQDSKLQMSIPITFMKVKRKIVEM